MHHDGPTLTDEDLRRLAQLGGRVDQIAEAAGIDPAQVRRRLAAVDRWDDDREGLPTLATEVVC